jgi:exodeoxyribonuclease-3
MRIASWNVNSVRARLPRVGPWLMDDAPEVVGLQETKVEDDDFPREAFEAAGYRLALFGQKTYNGVAIASKLDLEDVSTGLPGEGPDDQKRVIEATVDGVRVINLYVPNGESPDSDKFAYKMEWLETLRKHIADRYSPEDPIVMVGDYNIAPDDRDIYDPVAKRGTIHVSEPERAALKRIRDWGFSDAHRLRTRKRRVYTWWDFRGGMFEKGLGYRIDLILVTAPMAARLTDVRVDLAARGGEKPSDHAPVIATFDRIR